MNEKPYDSIPETLAHIRKVQDNLNTFALDLIDRGGKHDHSKLQDPERAAFDHLTPRLKGLTYGSSEYKSSLREMKPAIDHHYSVNDHHPEFFHSWECANPGCKCGVRYTTEDQPDKCDACEGTEFKNRGDIEQMNLMQLVEMLCDWKAAVERHEDGDIMKSFEINEKRFSIPQPIMGLLRRTARDLWGIE